MHQQHCFKLYDENQWNIKKAKYIFKICISLMVYIMLKVHEKLAFQKIRIKLIHIVIKSYTLRTPSNFII